MSKKHVIEFTRSKAEAKKIYFGKLFRKQIFVYAIRLVGIVPISIFFSTFFAVATQMIFNLGERGTNWLMFIWTLLIIYPFINPIIKIFQQNKNQLNYIFGMKNEINNTFILDESEFTYKNDIFELKTTWENTKLLEIDTNFISFQTSVPSLQFWIPINKLTIEATELIKSQVSGK